MSPTLLELTVAILLLWLAWQIGVQVAPRVLASFLSFWRTPKPPGAGSWRSEKNVTPPSTASTETPPRPHGNPHG